MTERIGIEVCIGERYFLPGSGLISLGQTETYTATRAEPMHFPFPLRVEEGENPPMHSDKGE